MNQKVILTVAAITAFYVLVATGPSAHAQDYGSPAPASGFGSLFRGGGLGNLFQTPKRDATSPSGPSSMFGGLSGMIPSLSGNSSPNDVIGRMNQKSKQMIDRTSDWARQKKQQVTGNMFGKALGSIMTPTEPASPAKSAFDWLKPKTSRPPTQPPLRSASNYDLQPGIRY